MTEHSRTSLASEQGVKRRAPEVYRPTRTKARKGEVVRHLSGEEYMTKGLQSEVRLFDVGSNPNSAIHKL